MGFTDSLADYFGFEEHDTDLRTEVIAGITTFLAMAYIVVVNPTVLASAIQIQGVSSDAVYQMIAVVTLLASAVAMLVMAFYANRPFGLAPGLGLNAFFAYTVVGALGIPWQTGLAAVVTEGVIFILLTLVGAREYVIRLFPEPVKFAVGTGIGLFLAIIGLNAMGIVIGDGGTIVALGPVASNPVSILAVIGLFVTLALYARGVKGSIVIGIVGTTVLGALLTFAGVVDPGVLIGKWIQPGGFQPSAFPQATYDISPLVGSFVQGFRNVEPFGFALVVFTFFFVDFFDTAGTLVGVGQIGGFLDDDGNLPDIDKPLMADAVGTTVGGVLGTTTVTTFVESATGVEEGGRTGMTALVVAVLFLVSLVFVPLAAAIPQYAGHIALVVVGVLMLSNVTNVDWDDPTHSIPAALTIIVMPFAYSIAYGIAAGIVAYPVVKVATGESDDVRLGQWLLALAFVVYFVVRTSGILSQAI
ncbi:xanthine/uracil/thiamine/ascorbate permease family protein [Halarchaeum acidiphilum MH1-52-1]|uniref:Xanthine/uracil/thiamine/ascorbate permease family protein n=1 Tax=Halarchaeum acidiphilum MH1-52-1 TaxID=1261545 RepID=U2YFG3_9EURY|nr:NCS2 family permease [Halarchaeum acidiphilum]GAD52771.1 xanthine/uracil/thiamine/ascorbate permease family protein [Halarchaeum acidiphilum MH1-52-1]